MPGGAGQGGGMWGESEEMATGLEDTKIHGIRGSALPSSYYGSFFLVLSYPFCLFLLIE